MIYYDYNVCDAVMAMPRTGECGATGTTHLLIVFLNYIQMK